jgi:hypothetical protein
MKYVRRVTDLEARNMDRKSRVLPVDHSGKDDICSDRISRDVPRPLSWLQKTFSRLTKADD